MVQPSIFLYLTIKKEKKNRKLNMTEAPNQTKPESLSESTKPPSESTRIFQQSNPTFSPTTTRPSIGSA
jgi:hypothetical protein